MKTQKGVVNSKKEWCGCLYNPTYIVHAINSKRKRELQTGWGQKHKFKIQMTRILYTIIFLMAQKASVARLSGLICLCCISDCVFYRKEKGNIDIFSSVVIDLKAFVTKFLVERSFIEQLSTSHLVLKHSAIRHNKPAH